MPDEANRQGAMQIIHLDDRGSPDYWVELTAEYQEELGQWAGICFELGTAAQADTLAQVQAELLEAVELQLNETEKLTDIQEYLAENEVRVTRIKPSRQAGFTVAGSRLTA